jgi:hypothetical protein
VELLSDLEVGKTTCFHVNGEQYSDRNIGRKRTEKPGPELNSIKDAVIAYIEHALEPFDVSLGNFLGEAVLASNDRSNSGN